MRKIAIICILCSVFCTLSVNAERTAYITKVWEYVPAPGQFVNELPAYTTGADANDMCLKVEERIANNEQGMITLGGWGGYVVFSFDHPVVNVAGQKDFIVEGNAFYTDKTAGAAGGGSCEPGIVMVSYDANKNGKPDDTWYELAGSEYTNARTIHDYSVTYERPASDHKATPDPNHKYRLDTTHLHWTDNKGGAGYLEQVVPHNHTYYPQWISTEKMTFTGARLPDNNQWTGSMYVLYPFEYGYADNHPNDETAAQLDIEWAVDANGNKVHLDAIHFVKVYNGMHQQCGAIGETSTEITGAHDLHPDAPADVENTLVNSQPAIRKFIHNGQLVIIKDDNIYNPLGILINNN